MFLLVQSSFFSYDILLSPARMLQHSQTTAYGLIGTARESNQQYMNGIVYIEALHGIFKGVIGSLAKSCLFSC